ncbi:unnamed protein product [Chrysoparadoxa australica]
MSWIKILQLLLVSCIVVQSQASSFVSDRIVYENYRRMLQRDIKLPTGKVVTFDVLDQEHESVLVFVWHTATSTTTLIKEFQPGKWWHTNKQMTDCTCSHDIPSSISGLNEMGLGIVAGMYEPTKHQSPLEAAQFELEEEAHLEGGEWSPLLCRNSTVGMDKYSTNRCHAFLVVDPTPSLSPRPLDPEEFIEIVKNVPLDLVFELMSSGQLTIISSYTVLMAIEKLRALGLVQQL